MARGDNPHHVRLTAGPERGAAALARLDRDQPVDDPTALDQKLVHFAVDPIDFRAQFGQGFQSGGFGHGLDHHLKGAAASLGWPLL